MRKAAYLSFALLLGAAPPPPLAGVSVAVRNTNGRPIANAVVTVRLVGRATPGPRIGSGYAVRQQHIQIAPFLSVVPVTADVALPNLDPVRHQVYSFSPAKRFELEL